MSALAFKVKSKNGQQILKDLTSDSTVGELKMFLSSISDVSVERVCVLCGYPPKPLDINDDSKKLSEIGLKTGETLIVEEKPAPATGTSKPPDTKPVENGIASHETLAPCRPGILMKKVVPSDNSCLFTSIGKFFNKNVNVKPLITNSNTSTHYYIEDIHILSTSMINLIEDNILIGYFFDYIK